MTVTSIGYDGTVNEAQWAKLVPSAGSSEYGVLGAGDWKVSAHPSIAQAVNIAPGTGWGWGVMDTTDSTITVQCDAITSGTRWDLIMMHRDWTPPGGTTTGDKVTGTSTKQIPPRSTNPGVTDDQPIALVQWTAGQTQPTAIVDLRCWGGDGGVFAVDTLVLSYLTRIGAVVQIGTDWWVRSLDTNANTVWIDRRGAEVIYASTSDSTWAYNVTLTRHLADTGTKTVTCGLIVARTGGGGFSVPPGSWTTLFSALIPVGWRPTDVACTCGAFDFNGSGAVLLRIDSGGNVAAQGVTGSVNMAQPTRVAATAHWTAAS